MQKLQQNDFMNYRFLAGLRLNPAGNKAAFTVSQADEKENSYTSCLYLWENDEIRQLTSLGKERSFYWENDTTLLFPAVRSKKEQDRVKAGETFTSFYRLNLKGGEALPAFTLNFAVSSLRPMGDGRFILTGRIHKDKPDAYLEDEEARKASLKEKKDNKDYEVLTETPFWFNGAGYIDGNRTAMFLWNENSGECVRLTDSHFNVSQIEADGNCIYYTGSLQQTVSPTYNNLYCLDLETRETKTVFSHTDLMISHFEKVEGGFLFIGSKHERHGNNENPMGYFYDPEKDTLELIWENEESTHNSVGSDCRLGGGRSTVWFENELYFATTRGGNGVIHKINAKGEETPVYTGKGSCDVFDIKDGEILMIGMYDNRLQEIYAIRSGERIRLSHFNDEILADKYVAQYQPVTIQSQGAAVEGWVLLPYDYDPQKKYPAIFDIHGGPKTAYGEVFYHEMQYWANEGWFVFFCNPTGSDGYGNAFADIRGKYGTVDFENLMDFCDAVLEAYPAIDRSKVAVTGGSYGGFMTNWIIGHTDRFVCAATQRSISNWISFSGTADIGPRFGKDQMAAGLDNLEKLWFHSPLAYVENAVTPTLFIHSDEDYRCPMSEGMQLFTALVQKGVPAKMCVFHGENHELSRGGKPLHRARRLRELTDWFTLYTK